MSERELQRLRESANRYDFSKIPSFVFIKISDFDPKTKEYTFRVNNEKDHSYTIKRSMF